MYIYIYIDIYIYKYPIKHIPLYMMMPEFG